MLFDCGKASKDHSRNNGKKLPQFLLDATNQVAHTHWCHFPFCFCFDSLFHELVHIMSTVTHIQLPFQLQCFFASLVQMIICREMKQSSRRSLKRNTIASIFSVIKTYTHIYYKCFQCGVSLSVHILDDICTVM